MVMLTSKSKVLIADDARANQVIFSKLFDDDDFEIHLASDGNEALTLMQQIQPDVILIDLMMPGMDGFTLLREIRSRYTTIEMPVIVVSASDEIEDISRALKLGANDYITKPFDIDDYLKRVERQIDTKQHTHRQAINPIAIKKTIQSPATLLLYIFMAQHALVLDVTQDKIIILGRKDADSVRPIDVDFAPFNGSQSGISREHAYFEFTPDGLTLVDNGSTNGTYINGQRIPSHVPYPIHDRDQVTLGHLIFKVIDVNA